jgi:hypothetical protein
MLPKLLPDVYGKLRDDRIHAQRYGSIPVQIHAELLLLHGAAFVLDCVFEAAERYSVNFDTAVDEFGVRYMLALPGLEAG